MKEGNLCSKAQCQIFKIHVNANILDILEGLARYGDRKSTKLQLSLLDTI